MKTVLGLAGLLFSACASIQGDHVGKVVSHSEVTNESSSPIVLSATLVEDLSSEYFGYFDFTIENPSEKWLVVKILGVEFGNGGLGDRIKFITGEPLENWKVAMARIRQIENFNQASAMALIGGVGLGLAASSSNKSLQALGTAAAGGSAAYYVGTEVGAAIDSIERTKMSLVNHLLQDSTLVLPGLFAKKWLLVNSGQHDQTGYISKMSIRYTVNGIEEKSEIVFRDPTSAFASKWQARKKPTVARSTSLSDYQRR